MKIMTTNTLPSQRQRQRQRVRTRNGIRYFGWRGIILIAIVVLINMLALHHYGIGKSSIEFTHLPPHNSNAMENESKLKNVNANVNGKGDDYVNDIPSNMTFIGISLNADTVTDSAIRFLIEAACVHGIKSYILLGEGSNKPLTKKILAMIYHWHLPLPSIDGKDSDTTAADLKCINWIRVKTAPSQEVLKNTTRAHYLNASGSGSNKNKLRLKSGINNPLDPLSRIARIKRSREYQRQQLLENNTIRWGAHSWDWKYHDTVIGVLDLDLFGYPLNLTEVVDTAAQYLITGEEEVESESDYSAGDDDDKVGKQFHAICANGLQVSEGRRSYYDIFSTILLPNTWLHRESDRFTARGTLEGEDVDLAKMTQTKTLQWFLKEGTTHKTNSSHSGGVNHDDDDDDGNMKGRGNNQQQRYRVVPVRSCFNGFTLYRADIFFDSRCRYDMSDKSDDLYASKRERHTCEHIVFNECLRRTLAMDDVDHSFRIGVKPDLLTMWHLLQ